MAFRICSDKASAKRYLGDEGDVLSAGKRVSYMMISVCDVDGVGELVASAVALACFGKLSNIRNGFREEISFRGSR